jgi:hypothetical protein
MQRGRRYLQLGFSRASHTISVRSGVSSGGLPGTLPGYVQRRTPTRGASEAAPPAAPETRAMQPPQRAAQASSHAISVAPLPEFGGLRPCSPAFRRTTVNVERGRFMTGPCGRAPAVRGSP